ncbi:MAG: YybS family protein [Desulfuromonadaceae bacterium]|nr:YybS family protein [Desulfuromonadaceae bacterium]MDD2850042.1 YybS family protein [Desulfuromonadaceae bacterium]MDD4129446.1 YybS family protein [Desulfuromonadaceae bacterium]
MNQRSPTDHNLQLRIKSSLLGVVGSFVLFAAYLAIPPIGIFSGILAPFPAAYNRLIHGRIPALIVMFGTATAVTALFGILAGCLYLGMCGMIGLLMPELLLRGVSGSRAIFWTTAANVLIFSAGFIAYGTISGVNLQQLISAEISDSLKQAVIMYEKGGVTGEDLEVIKSSMNTAADMLQRLYPAIATSMLTVIAAFNLVLLKRTTAKTAVKVSIGDFSSFRNPELLVWVLIAAGFLLLLPASSATTTALNILLLITMLYFFQGMAVITALITKHSIPVFVRILLYTVLIIQPYLLALIAGIGLFDLWVDFRTPKTQENL